MKVPNGFIKESGVYKRNGYVFDGAHIIKESTLLPNKEQEDDLVQTKFETLEDCIREALQFSGDIGQELRTKDIYIDKVKDGEYKVSEKKSKNTEAIITPDNNVYKLNITEIPNQDDSKELANPDKDNAKAPKEIKEIETKPEELKETDLESGKLYSPKEIFKHYTDQGMPEEQAASLVASLMCLPEVTEKEPSKEDIKRLIASLKEAEIFNQEKFTKLVKQANDLELEQLKAATCEEDIASARATREATINQLLKTTNLHAPSDKEVKEPEMPEEIIDEEPITESMDEKYFLKTIKDVNGTFFKVYKKDGKFYDANGKELTSDEVSAYKLTEAEDPISFPTSKFVRLPHNIDEVLEHMPTSALASYIISDEISLSQAEFDEYCGNLQEEKDFLRNFKPEKTTAVFNCIKVTTDNGNSLIIDPSGYATAQYVSII